MPDIHLKGPPMQDRINARLQNSGTGRGTTPDQTIQTGNSARRTYTNLHHSAGAKQHSPVAGTPKKPAGPLG